MRTFAGRKTHSGGRKEPSGSGLRNSTSFVEETYRSSLVSRSVAKDVRRSVWHVAA